MTTKAKDGRETLQERRMSVSGAKSLGYTVDETVNPILAYKGPRFRPTEYILVISDELAAAQAEIARLTKLLDQELSKSLRSVYSMPEAFGIAPDPITGQSDARSLAPEELPLVEQALLSSSQVDAPLPVAEDVVERAKKLGVQIGSDAWIRAEYERLSQLEAASLLRQPEAAPGGWQLVPKTPDENMIRAYKGAVKEYIQSLPESERQHTKTARGGYPVPERIKATVRFAAMLASAPTPASAPDNFEDRLKELFGCEIIAGANTIGDLRKLTAKIVALHFEALASTPAPASAQDELVKALEEANKRIAKLERLLRPFAAEAYLWGENVPDRYRPLVTEPKQRVPSGGARTAFNIGNCRRAAAALSATGGAK